MIKMLFSVLLKTEIRMYDRKFCHKNKNKMRMKQLKIKGKYKVHKSGCKVNHSDT